MKILIIKNKGIKVPISDDINDAFKYLEAKTPLKYELSYLDVDLKLEFKIFLTRRDGRNVYGTTGTKEKLRQLIKEKEYDIVIFFHFMDNKYYPNKDYVTSWCFWEGLYPNTNYLEVVVTKTDDRNGHLESSISHEMMHALCAKVLQKRAVYPLDEMDMTIIDGKAVEYYLNHDPYAPDGNYARTIKNLSNHWDLFMPKKYKYFSDKEVAGLSEKLCLMLDKAREFAGVPFVLTSTVRSEEKNAEVGGVKDSAHTKGLAVDIRAETSMYRYRVFKGLVLAGFNRIGIYKKHIHADIDNTKPEEVTWLG